MIYGRPALAGFHQVGLGVGNTILNGDFADYGEDKITFDGFYSYLKAKPFYPLLNIHHFKSKSGQQYFTSTALVSSIAYDMVEYDGLTLSPFVGLGFYRPYAKRFVGSTLVTTNKKMVLGTTLGLNVKLDLNPLWAFAFLFQYHNPFDKRQDIGPDFEGHYVKLMAALFYRF